MATTPSDTATPTSDGTGPPTSSDSGSRSSPKLEDGDLPAIYQAADHNSRQAQWWFKFLTGVGLVMLVVAAIGGAVNFKDDVTDWGGVIAATAFFIALLVRWSLLNTRPDQEWYEGRAVAESAKTLGWRYAVGGEPFRILKDSDADEAAIKAHEAKVDALFLERLHEVLTTLRGLHLVPEGESYEVISDVMRDFRKRPLLDRQKAYEQGRIVNQRDWYARKSRENRRRAQQWELALFTFEVAGGVAAIFKAIGRIDFDLLGITAAITAAGISWLQIRQHASLAVSYAVTSYELEAVRVRVMHQATEEEWAHFVDQAEEAISREHILWRASRTDKR
jgi:hypothetical protein